METRGRGRGSGTSWKPHSKNRQWVAGQDSGSGHGGDGERWERGGHRRGRGRGRGQFTGNHSSHLPTPQSHDDGFSGTEDEEQDTMDEAVGAPAVEREPDTQEDREKFFQEVRATLSWASWVACTYPFAACEGPGDREAKCNRRREDDGPHKANILR